MEAERTRLFALLWVPLGLAVLAPAPAAGRIVDLDVVADLSEVAIEPTSGVYFDRAPEDGGTVFVPFALQSGDGTGGPTNGLHAAATGRLRVDFRPEEGTLAIDRFRTLFTPVASGAWLPGIPDEPVIPAAAQAAVSFAAPAAFATGVAALRDLALTIGATHGIVATGAGHWEWPDGPFDGASPDVVELRIADGRVDFDVDVIPTLTQAYVREGAARALSWSAARRARLVESSGDRLELRLPIDVAIEEPLVEPVSGLPIRVRLDLDGEIVARNFVPEPAAATAALAAIAGLALLGRRRRRANALSGFGRPLALLGMLVFLIGVACGPVPGGTCYNDDQCPDFELCVDNVCTEEDLCEHPADCAGGLLCRTGVCAPPATTGGACEAAGDCASDTCTNGTCAAGDGVIDAGGVVGPTGIAPTFEPFGLTGEPLVTVAGANGLVVMNPLTGVISTAGRTLLSLLGGPTYEDLRGALVLRKPTADGADALLSLENGYSVNQHFVLATGEFGPAQLLSSIQDARDAVHFGDDPSQPDALVTHMSGVRRFRWSGSGTSATPIATPSLTNFGSAGPPASAFTFPGATRILAVTSGATGKLVLGDPANATTAVTVVGDVGDARRIRCLGEVCVISAFGSDELVVATWDGGTNVAITDTQPVGDGPEGIDLLPLDDGNIGVVSTGSIDATISLTIVTSQGLVVESSIVLAPSRCDGPTQALWLGDTEDHAVVSCRDSNTLWVLQPLAPQ
jgi:hypothetical protein